MSPDGLLVAHAGPGNADVWCSSSMTFSEPGEYRMTVRLRAGLVMALGFQVADRDLFAPWAPGEPDREIFHPARGQYGGDGVWPRGAVGVFAPGDRLGFALRLPERRVEIFRNGVFTGHMMNAPAGGALRAVFCLHEAGGILELLSTSSATA